MNCLLPWDQVLTEEHDQVCLYMTMTTLLAPPSYEAMTLVSRRQGLVPRGQGVGEARTPIVPSLRLVARRCWRFWHRRAVESFFCPAA